MSSSWKAFAGVALVFLLGMVAGALITAVHFKHRATAFFERGAPAYVELLERSLTRGMTLDDTQRQQIHDAFLQNIEGRKKLQGQIQPQVQELNQETMRQIRTILRPEQVTTFRENLEAFRRRFGRAAATARDMDQPADTSQPVGSPAPGQ